MDVIDLNGRRRDRDEPAPDYTVCPCGEAWFELRNGPPSAPHGAFCLRPDGTITGWAGVPHCVACGAAWHTGPQTPN